MAGLPPLAEVRDLADWVGEDIESTDRRAGAVLRAASALVRHEAGNAWVDDTGELVAYEDIPEQAISITVQAAARAWANPDGYATERLGDYSYGKGSDFESGVYLTSTERVMLTALRPRPARIGVISTTRGDIIETDSYAPVADSNRALPW